MNQESENDFSAKWLQIPVDEDDGEKRGLTLLKNLATTTEIWNEAHPHSSTIPPYSITDNCLRLLEDWLNRTLGSASNIMWLSGVPSSLCVQELSTICRGRCLLAASFSFSSRRGSEQAQRIVPILAHQISFNIPTLRPFIGRAVAHNSEIFFQPLDVQLETIIFSPFRECAAAEGRSHLRSVVLINGLALYHDLQMLKLVIRAIEMVATTSSIPLRFVFTTHQSPREYKLPLLPGTHVHVHNGPNAPQLHKSRLAMGFNNLRKPKPHLYHGFPQPIQVQSGGSAPESYTRSLIMLGHGIPLWRPTGDPDAPLGYFQHGPQIGDVMSIDDYGVVLYFFNIFRARDDPVNCKITRLGEYYEPLTLDPSEVIRTDDYFKPGAIVASSGVLATEKCKQPLTVSFKSNSDEGAFLVLPNGASRQDLMSTNRFHKYVQRWAPYWYKFCGVANGAIFVVTGCDKASDFACATFPADPLSQDGAREIDMDYVQSAQGEDPWRRHGRVRAHFFSPQDYESATGSTWLDSGRRLCVFIRGMRIGLGSAVWSSYNTSSLAREKKAYTRAFHKPTALAHATESLMKRLQSRPPEYAALMRVSTRDSEFFHPMFLVGPELLQKYPNASVVILNDSDWGTLTHDSHGDWNHFKSLVDQLHEQFIVIEEDGIISLSRKGEPYQKSIRLDRGVFSVVSRLFRHNIESVRLISLSKFVHSFGEDPIT